MSNQILDNFNEAGQTAYDAVKDVIALNQAVFGEFVEKQLQVADQIVDFTVKHAKLVTDTKDQRSLFQGQVALVEEAAEQALDNVRDVVEIANKARASYEKLAEKNVKTATEQLKKVPAKKAA